MFVGQVRFSISLCPFTTSQAQGCRMLMQISFMSSMVPGQPNRRGKRRKREFLRASLGRSGPASDLREPGRKLAMAGRSGSVGHASGCPVSAALRAPGHALEDSGRIPRGMAVREGAVQAGRALGGGQPRARPGAFLGPRVSIVRLKIPPTLPAGGSTMASGRSGGGE